MPYLALVWEPTYTALVKVQEESFSFHTLDVATHSWQINVAAMSSLQLQVSSKLHSLHFLAAACHIESSGSRGMAFEALSGCLIIKTDLGTAKIRRCYLCWSLLRLSCWLSLLSPFGKALLLQAFTGSFGRAQRQTTEMHAGEFAKAITESYSRRIGVQAPGCASLLSSKQSSSGIWTGT